MTEGFPNPEDALLEDYEVFAYVLLLRLMSCVK